MTARVAAAAAPPPDERGAPAPDQVRPMWQQ
jgi:hypothetical protein